MPRVTTGLEGSEKRMETRKLVECPLCKMVGAKFLCDVGGYQIWRCSRCTLDFVSPVPEEEFLKAYYSRKDWFEGGERGGYESYDQQTHQVLPVFLDLLTQYEAICSGRNILDVGCGYANHLAVAAERGWRPFGVEVSAHALQIARERHGSRMFLTDRIEGLVPCEFDLVLLFDVIEHTRDPFSLFFKLFSKGAISPKTQIAITTPNARSCDAVVDPAKWAYRHPPSHLFFYSAEALQRLMSTLHFREVEVSGLHPIESPQQAGYEDEFFPANNELQGYSGLLCRASGSDFKEFMHERYVPGTWSKITEYEHLPRYVFAQKRAQGARVLDFGCGTGYGGALLADVAKAVVGVDIDPSALRWATQFHNKSNLKFELCSDLGKKLPAESFDLITCFELIEHLSEDAQREFMENARRLLAPGGELLISTPNPVVTVNYGENPYHLHEMDETEFRSLLESRFRYVEILGQWIRPSVAIAAHSQVKDKTDFYESRGDSATAQASTVPSNFLAICSQRSIGQSKALCCFDSSFDYIAATFTHDKKFHELQSECYGLQETAGGHKKVIAGQQEVIARQQETIAGQQEAIVKQQETIHRIEQEAGRLQQEIARLHQEIAELHQLVQSRNEEIALFKRSKIYRLRHAIRHEPLSFVKIARVVYLVGGMLTPYSIRRRVQPLAARAKATIAEIQLKRAQARTARATTRAAQAAPKAAANSGKEVAARIEAKEKRIFEPATLEYLEEEHTRESGHKAQRVREIASKITHVSVVIISKNAGPSFPKILNCVKEQELEGLSLDVTVIDYCSTDDTVARVRAQGVNVIQVSPARFDHGLARNLAFKKTTGDVVVFLGQHAIPNDIRLVQQLVKPFDDPLVAGVYGRRVPPQDEAEWALATLSGQSADKQEFKVQVLQDAANYNSMTPAERYQLCNFDSACCAIRRCVWQEIPFRLADFVEGLEWSKRVLEAGWKTAYQPAACVVYPGKQSLNCAFQETYLLHKALFQLFGLNIIPSLKYLVVSWVRSVLRGSLPIYQRKRNFFKRIGFVAKLPALSFVTAYAQYRSVQDMQTLAKKEAKERTQGVFDH